MKEFYKTKQRELVLKTIKNKKNEFVVKDIYEELNKKVGLTTIYRIVDKLVQEGNLTKIIGKDNITYFQYLEKCNNSNHFYLKCSKCGKITHVDCDCITDLTNHISENHDFKMNNDHIIINGMCKKCQGKDDRK